MIRRRKRDAVLVFQMTVYTDRIPAVIENGRFMLTEHGMELQNAVVIELLG